MTAHKKEPVRLNIYHFRLLLGANIIFFGLSLYLFYTTWLAWMTGNEMSGDINPGNSLLGLYILPVVSLLNLIVITYFLRRHRPKGITKIIVYSIFIFSMLFILLFLLFAFNMTNWGDSFPVR